MSKNYQNVNNLKISEELLSFVNKELLKDLDISSEKFWEGFDNAVHDLAPHLRADQVLNGPSAQCTREGHAGKAKNTLSKGQTPKTRKSLLLPRGGQSPL